MKAMLVLKGGVEIEIVLSEGFKVSPKDFTEVVVHRFPTSRKSLIFVQGDRINYVEVLS